MTTKRRLAAIVAALATSLGLLTAPASPVAAQEAPEQSILVFSKTAAFRHGSIEAGVQAIQDLGLANGVTVDATEDAADFTEENLDQYDAVVWLSTTGDVLDADQQAAFEAYVNGGGGYVGIHAASDTEYDWPWYADLVGAYFEGHPPGTPVGTVVTEDFAHPSTDHLDTRWTRDDEWYSFQDNPRNDVHVLQSLDESSYDAGNLAMGDHPISWCQTYDGGRAWYTGLGHTNASFAEPAFLDLIWGGIQYAAGIAAGDCGATDWNNYQKVTLDDNTSNPMALEVAPDGRVFYIDRSGPVRIIHPDGTITTAGVIDVTTVQEFGLIGLALDPDFETNNWIYLTYSPVTGGDRDVVSRFTMAGDTIDASSEVEIIEIPTQRAECCHAGGEIEFDSLGNLYIATGDNTNPFASDGYAPIDERAGRAAWDAQRSAANTNVLNGKILRITPQDDGSYTIPDGNLFDEALDTGDLTRPEI
jgi:type 1 glutamine amidotransferase